MTTTTALTGRTRIPTLYPAKACHYCGTAPTAVGYQTPTGWVSVCETCAASWKAQVLGLVGRIDGMATADTAPTLAAAVTPHVSALVTEALQAPGDASQAARTVVPTLLAIVALGTSLAPAPVRANAHPGKCADCGVTVPAGAGSLTKDGGRWTVRHLAGACTVSAPVAVAVIPEPLPVGLHVRADGTVVKVYETQNGRLAGKVLVGSSFAYERGATRDLSAATLMTAEQARAYGRTTGHCCACGEMIGHGDTASTLVSLAQGYGPVCAKRNGWPVFSQADAVATLRAEGITHPLLANA